MMKLLAVGNLLGFFAFAASVWFVAASPGLAQWEQWGGPSRDFKLDLELSKWPDSGPKKLWERELGEGYSGFVVDGERVYTMVRRGGENDREAGKEVVIALSAETGATVWELEYPAPIPEAVMGAFGFGPRATPLVIGDRLLAVGLTGQAHCLDRKSGKVLWKRDLLEDAGGRSRQWGYAVSPLIYRDTVIVVPGGEDAAIEALSLSDGSLVWKSLSFESSYASPILIEVDGQEQLVSFMATHILGVDPSSGRLLWSHPHENRYKDNINTPIWGEDQLLYLSSYGDMGSRVLSLRRKDDQTHVEELWFNRRIKHGHASVVRVGDTVYGTSGNYEAPFFFVAVNVKDGSLRYRKRGFDRSHCVFANGLLVLLDDQGNLSLATPTEEKIVLHCKTKILEGTCWTGPAFHGRRMFVRNRTSGAGFELPPTMTSDKN